MIIFKAFFETFKIKLLILTINKSVKIMDLNMARKNWLMQVFLRFCEN